MGSGAAGFGSVLTTYATLSNQQSQSEAESKNISGLTKQAQDTQDVFDRKLMLLQKDQDKYLGSLDSDFAKAGIDFSGSALEIYGQTKQDMRSEQNALKAEAYSVQERFQNEISNAKARKDALDDPFTKGATILGGGLSFAGSRMGKGV